MEPVSAALLSTFARAILTRAGDLLLSSTPARDIRTKIFGDPEHRALARALQRAFDKTRAEHGLRLAEYEANFGDRWLAALDVNGTMNNGATVTAAPTQAVLVPSSS